VFELPLHSSDIANTGVPVLPPKIIPSVAVPPEPTTNLPVLKSVVSCQLTPFQSSTSAFPGVSPPARS